MKVTLTISLYLTLTLLVSIVGQLEFSSSTAEFNRLAEIEKHFETAKH